MMRSSFPRRGIEADEKYLYDPVVQSSLLQRIRRISRSSRKNVRILVAVAVTFLFSVAVFWRRGAGGEAFRLDSVVLVTVLEWKDAAGEDVRIIDRVLENRREYANAYGNSALRRGANG